jgi:hypothetical protein
VLLSTILPLSHLYPSIHIEDDPPVASRSAIEKTHKQVVLASGGTPVNPAQTIAGGIFPYTGSADRTFKGIGAGKPFANPPTWGYLNGW